MFFPIIMQYGSGALCEEKGKKGAVVFQNQGGISVSFFIKFRDLFQKQAFCKCWNCQVTPCPVLTGTQNVIVCPKEHVSWVKTEMLGGGGYPLPLSLHTKSETKYLMTSIFLSSTLCPFLMTQGLHREVSSSSWMKTKGGSTPFSPSFMSLFMRAPPLRSALAPVGAPFQLTSQTFYVGLLCFYGPIIARWPYTLLQTYHWTQYVMLLLTHFAFTN